MNRRYRLIPRQLPSERILGTIRVDPASFNRNRIVTRALIRLRKRIDGNPNDYGTRIKLGLQLARQKRLDDAVVEFAQATECPPEADEENDWRYISGFFFAATIHKRLGNQKESQDCYQRGCKYLPATTTGEQAIGFAIGELIRGTMSDESRPVVVEPEE